MKSILLLFCTVSFISFGNYLKPETVTKSENHLLEINKNWNSWKDRMNSEAVSFQSDEERIQYHLFQVIDLLNENSVDHSGNQLENRKGLIELLTGYAQNGVFPTNHYHSVRRPYFVDNYGVHCAVGYLMAVSGHEELVQRIREEHNFDYIMDIKTEGVIEWANEFGFSLEELKLIQPGYWTDRSLVSVQGGVNAEVTNLVVDSYRDRLFVIGDFTEVNGQLCSNLGVFQNNTLSCFDGSLNGNVKDIVGAPNSVFMVGSFESQGVQYPIVNYVNDSPQFISIPNRPNAVGVGISRVANPYSIVVAVEPDGNNNVTEIWKLNNQGEWVQLYDIFGKINDMTASHFVGVFDSVAVISENSTNVVASKNAFIGNPENNQSFAQFQGEVSDTIYSLAQYGNAVYFCGACSYQPGRTDVCLSRYADGQLQTVLSSQDLKAPGSFVQYYYALKSISAIGGNFLLGGRFTTSSFFYSGRNLSMYNYINHSVGPEDVLNGEVNKIISFEGEIYVGGDFPSSVYGDLHYLARYAPGFVSVDNIENPTISVYPNPFENQLTIDGVSANSSFEMVQMNGQVIRKGQIMNGKINELDDLSKGIYLLKIQSEGVEKTIRITK